jgi:hypothetical protein
LELRRKIAMAERAADCYDDDYEPTVLCR